MEPRCRNCNSPYSVKLPDGKRRCSNSSSLKLPLLLQCGHVYCSACLHKLSSLHSTDLPCPECRYPTLFSRGVDLVKQFPLSYYTLGLTVAHLLGIKNVIPLSTVPNGKGQHLETKWPEIDDLNCSTISSESVTLCEECDQTKAEYLCQKCDCKLCNKCFDQIHSVSKVLKTHTKVIIEPSGQKMSNDRQSQLTAAMRTAQKHQHSLALTRNNLCVARQKLNDCKTKFCRGEELIQICQARIQKVARSLYLEISKQEEKLDDFDCELRKVEESKRRAVVKCHTVLQTNEEKEDLDNLLFQLTCAVDIDTCPLSEVHIPRIIINRDVLQESLEDSYHLAAESSSSVFNTPQGVKEEEEEEEHNETTSSFSLSPPQVNDLLGGCGLDDVNDSSASVNVIIKEDGESVRSCTPVGQSTPNLQSSQFLSPSLSPKVPRGYSSCTSSSRGSTPGPTDNDMTGAVGVIVSHINSPSEFYIQYTSDLPSLDQFHSELKANILQRVSDLQKNMVCVLVREDSYRRCQVESHDDHSYPSVQLLDYGNSEIVNVHSLFSLSSKLKDTPLFAHRCRLEGVGPMSSRHEKYQITPQNVWSHSASSFFKSVCEDKTDLKMKVLSKEGNILFVDIIIPSSSGGLSVARQLVTQGKAKRCKNPKPQLPLHQLPPIEPLPLCSTHRVSMITASSPHDFYVQLSTDSNDMRLAHIATQIKETVCLPRASSNFQIGSLVIAPYEDEYYRAKILSRVKGGFRVLFLDYGNICVVPKKSLYPLDDVVLLNEPPAVLHCRLVDVNWTNGYLSWPEEVCEFFHKMTTDIGKDLLMTIVPVSTRKDDTGSIIPVALRDSSMNLIAPTLIKEGRASYISEWSKPALPILPREGTSKPAIVSHVDKPTKFHVHLSSNLETLQTLESVLDDLPPPPPSYYPLPLDYCLAYYSSTHRFHRAFIEFVRGRKVGVFFIDYGDRKEIDVNDIRPMLGVALTVPAMALPCSLDGFGVGISAGGVELVMSDSLEFTGIVIDQEVNVVFKKKLEICSIPLFIVDIFVKRAPQVNPVNVLSLLPSLASKQVTMATKPPSSSSSTSPLTQSPLVTPDVSLKTTPISSGRSSPMLKSKSGIPGRKAPVEMKERASYLKEVWPETSFHAVITWVNEKGFVYGQPVANKEYLSEVEASIVEAVSMHGSAVTAGANPDSLSVAQACLARYSYQESSDWYRGTILKLNKHKKAAIVHFVDYGNTEAVPFDDIIDCIVAPHVPMLVLKLKSFNKRYPINLLEEVLIDKAVQVAKGVQESGDIIMTIDGIEIEKYLSTFKK